MIPETVKEAWERREGPIIFGTVADNGKPNIIYATCVSLYGDDRVVVADNYFDKTRRNIKSGCMGTALFMTDENKAYQLKGTIEYHEDGPVFDDMKKWNPSSHPGHAAAALVISEVYSGAEQITS